MVLGDQPWLRPEVVAEVLDAATAATATTDAALPQTAPTPPRPIIRVRYADDDAPNPVLIRRTAWALAAGLEGDRGLGPLLGRYPDLVEEVPIGGRNPDVDTPADLPIDSSTARLS